MMKVSTQIALLLLICLSVWSKKIVHETDRATHQQILRSKQQKLLSKKPDQVSFSEAAEAYGQIVGSSAARIATELNYKQNIRDIVESNSNLTHTYKQGINKFVFLSRAQFKAKYLTLRAPKGPQPAVKGQKDKAKDNKPKVGNSPRTVNWRSKMTGVRDQGGCGSCWSFATIAEIEGRFKMKTTRDLDLSEQHILDCNTFNYGCDGGWYDCYRNTVTFGLMLQADYAYTASKGTCRYNSNKVAVRLSRSRSTIWGSCRQIQIAMLTGPVSVAVEANWPFYSSGIRNICTYGQIDHAVVAVGWHMPSRVWLLKNSWGSTWGQSGYIRLAGGPGGSCNNICQYGAYYSVIR